jgi:YVTN family beta-propeller protein
MGPWILLAALASDGGERLVTGKLISPIGTHEEVGSYPSNILLLPGGEFAAVSTMGFRQALTIVRAADGKVAGRVEIPRRGNPTQGLYYGLAFDPEKRLLYASRGAMDKVTAYKVGGDGSLAESGQELINSRPDGALFPLHPAGIALNSRGTRMVVVNNQTTHQTNYKGSVSVIDIASGKELSRIPVGGFPYSAALMTEGSGANVTAFVGSERDGEVAVVDIAAGKVTHTLRTGAAPAAMTFGPGQTRLYVSNAHSDTISVIDTAAKKVIDTILVRPAALPGLPGATPQGLAVSPDGTTLYAALSDMNCLGVIDLNKRALVGYIPTGWLPTSVVATQKELLVTCAKGVQAANPNSKPVGDKGTYVQDIIAGTVTRIPLEAALPLKPHTEKVIANNLLRKGLNSRRLPQFKNPGIKHVIYVIKENRTYDNVLGDIERGNGDPSITLFPRRVTPNQHALAERFVQLDNFHVCAEVSQDGWVWSTAGMVNAYASRNTPYNYSGRGRSYDTEGSNNGVPVDLIDLPDVTRPPGGYIWELCQKHKVTYRNYGFFTQFTDPSDKRFDILKEAKENEPAKKALVGMTNTNFRRYDLTYADSEAYQAYRFSWPRQRKTYGEFKSVSRFTEWKREFDEFVKAGKMPQFQMVRFGQDHTSGTQSGQPTPQSMVADNDYAVGQMVEAVSNSPFWKNTVICILEDDAQAGIDHVDAHRSIAFVISPYVKRGQLDSRFYNTSSMLRTMELLLGLPPMNQYDAVASPLDVFGRKLENAEPYKAILPDREIICEINPSSSAHVVSDLTEESEEDEELNEVLWTAIMGKDRPFPGIRKAGMRFRD